MGGTSSKSESGGGGGFSVFLLCGGSDNVVEDTEDAVPKPFLENYARPSSRRVGARRPVSRAAAFALFSCPALAAAAPLAGESPGKTPSKRELRIARSASTFVVEFKTEMKRKGFTAIKCASLVSLCARARARAFTRARALRFSHAARTRVARAGTAARASPRRINSGSTSRRSTSSGTRRSSSALRRSGA